MNMKLPERCPFCGGDIKISEFKCSDCDAIVSGSFKWGGIPVSEEQWEFIRLFIRVRGNLKKIGEILDLSYPTVRARLEEVRMALGFPPSECEKDDIISELEMGIIDVEEALRKLEKKGGNKNE
ncbi:DUF2089 domain-containing protein [candidate division WOR-3 bacterium]|nr:DUF2089 domain-containing protein [candidate division WOR-3 bacterium]